MLDWQQIRAIQPTVWIDFLNVQDGSIGRMRLGIHSGASLHVLPSLALRLCICAVCAAGIPAGALPGGLWAMEGSAAPAALLRRGSLPDYVLLLCPGSEHSAHAAELLLSNQQVILFLQSPFASLGLSLPGAQSSGTCYGPWNMYEVV